MSEWIPVSERLPQIGEQVFVTVEGCDNGKLFVRGVDMALFIKEKGYIDGFDTVNDWIEYGEWRITAWMPVPSPWKGEDDANES